MEREFMRETHYLYLATATPVPPRPQHRREGILFTGGMRKPAGHRRAEKAEFYMNRGDVS